MAVENIVIVSIAPDIYNEFKVGFLKEYPNESEGELNDDEWIKKFARQPLQDGYATGRRRIALEQAHPSIEEIFEEGK